MSSRPGNRQNFGRGQYRNRRSNNNRGFVTNNRMKVQLKGTKLRVPNDPPSVNPFPFFQMVLVFVGKGTKLFTDSSLTNGLQSQCGFTVTSGFKIQVKLQKVYVWQEIPLTTGNMPFPLQAPLTVNFYNVFGEGSLSVQGDFGTEVRYSKVGYLWPITDRTATLDSDPADDSLFQITPTDTDQGWMCHVHVLWAIHKPKATSTSIATGADIL